MKKLAIVGTLVYDRVVDEAGSERTGFGGIAYAVGAAAALGRGRLQIRPVCRVASSWQPEIRELWNRWACVDLSGLIAWDGPPTRVELRYRGAGVGHGGVGGDRQERLLNPVPPMDEREVRGARGCDAVLVNCVSGFDLTAVALETLAEDAGPLLLDVHSLMLGRRADGTRFGRRILDLDRWLRVADAVQCNRSELAIMTGCATLREGLSAIRRAGWGGTLLVTAGGTGAVVAFPSRKLRRIPAPAIEAVDPTGAGDVFGAAWSVARLLGASREQAARTAVQAASVSCGIRGVESLDRLGGMVG